MKPYQQAIQSVATQFKTNVQTGLSEQEAKDRLRTYGPNTLPEPPRETVFSIFINQFKNPLIYILLIAAALIFFVGEDRLDAFIISVVIFFNAIIGTIQEGRTKNIVASLKRFIKTKSVVIRNSEHQIIEDKDLVVGDLIVLQEGERVPADARIIEANNVQVDEAVLTGESQPIVKTTQAIEQEMLVADRINMVFKGTYVLTGSGKAIVVATGTHTEIGALQRTIEEIETDIPLRKELDYLSYLILLFILGACLFLLVLGLVIGRPVQELLVMLTALFICVVPEGLPVVLTLVLVSGAYRMARKNVLVKNLQGVEGLGRTDVIVVDKTGTLTRNEMIVSAVFADHDRYRITGQGYHVQGDIFRDGTKIEAVEPGSATDYIGIASSLLNTAEINFIPKLGLFEIKGDPTEAALFVLSRKLGLQREQLERQYRKLYEIPFDSVLKYHAGFYEYNGQGIAYIIGSPEVVMERSDTVDQSAKDSFAHMLDEGLRVVAVGMKKIPLSAMPKEKDPRAVQDACKQLLERDIAFLGLCGIQDSIRPEVRSMIEQARAAGLKIIMATGDHKKTAEYVAKQAGIYQEGDEIVDGVTFGQLTDDELLKRLDKITVYARVAPEAKVRIIDLFHRQGVIVAMTGDGVNDVPSLLAADLGIAMGGIGTEVAKQAADLILLDDSFVNIINAIKEGRHIFYTLRRVILYFFSTNMGEILIVLFALLVNLPLPLTAAQILWLNLVTDGFLDVGLSMEPQEPGLLARRSGRKPQLVDRDLLGKMMFMAVPMGVGSLGIFWWYYAGDIVYARTMTLVTMAMFQWFNAWNCRSEQRSLFQLGFFANKWLIVATLFVLSLQFALLHVPAMQYIFKTMPLSAQDWAVIVLVSAPIILFEEVRKYIVRRREQNMN